MKDFKNVFEGFYGDPRFYEILLQIAKLHSDKNHDYAGDNPLSNFRECERLGIPAWKGVLVRISDKVSRIFNFAKTGKLHVQEKIEDTLMDLAVYSIICLILYKEEQVKE